MISKEDIEKLDSKYTKMLFNTIKEFGNDIEVRHIVEDKLLLDLLKELGFKKVADQYNSTEKRYK